MFIKNGQVYYRGVIKKGVNKQGSFIFKNGSVYHNLPFKKIPSIITGYGQKVLSIASNSVNKIIGVARTAIEKVIGVE